VSRLLEEPNLDIPRPQANRRTKFEWAGSGNNTTMLGLGTAMVGGRKTVGAYILATPMSAKGITWNYGLPVYATKHEPHWPQYGNAWFVSFSRVGQKIKQGSEHEGRRAAAQALIDEAAIERIANRWLRQAGRPRPKSIGMTVKAKRLPGIGGWYGVVVEPDSSTLDHQNRVMVTHEKDRSPVRRPRFENVDPAWLMWSNPPE
jgi:hypothetical protein